MSGIMGPTRTVILFMAAGFSILAQPVSVTPQPAQMTSQNFTFTFNGSDVVSGGSPQRVLINYQLDGRNACYFSFLPPSSAANTSTAFQLVLVNDAGASGGPYQYMSPGTAPIGNSQCTISNFSVSMAGVTVAFNVTLTASGAFQGNQLVYLGNDAGWRSLGIWNVPISGSQYGLPIVSGMTPNRSLGFSQTFSFSFADTYSNGQPNVGVLSVVNVLINSALDGRSACYLGYVPTPGNPTTGTLTVVRDGGPGTSGNDSVMSIPGGASAQNIQCTISGAYATVSGSVLTLNFTATFGSGFVGDQAIWAAAISGSGSSSGWQPVGTVSIASTEANANGHFPVGWLDGADCSRITGWAVDIENPTAAQNVTLYIDSVPTAFTGIANLYRSDLVADGIGNGYYGFSIPTPAALQDGQAHTITVAIGSPAYLLNTTFSCRGGRVTTINEGGCAGSYEITFSAIPTFGGQTYSTNDVSGFYMTTPGDTLSTYATTTVLNVVKTPA